MEKNIKKYNIGVLMICLNSSYWEFAKELVGTMRANFLTNHNVDYLLWTDMPPETNYDCKIISTEPIEWPYPTLLRYDLFLQEEETLKQYDYLFYIDIDMKVVDKIDEEILGDGLTAALHPMYALRHQYKPPYEPNPESTAYIPEHFYYAGGFQGGKSSDFIKAMWTMKRNIGKDFDKNYRARWNDESHWNKYLYDNQPSVILSPAYIYPDSLIKEYYIPIWGQDYKPKIITLTKRFTTTEEGGEALKKMLETIHPK